MVLIILYTVFSILYVKFSSLSKEDFAFKLIIVLTLPFIGFLFLLITGFLSNKTEHDKYSEQELNEAAINEKFILPHTLYLDKEINTVPVEEALIINDNSIKRGLIIDILKEDTEKYIGTLIKALTDEDTETSHYAATAIAEIRQQFNSAIQDFTAIYYENKTHVATLKKFADILKKYLESGLLDNKSFLKKRILYSEVLENLIENYMPEEKYFIYKINCELDMGDMETAALYCRKFKEAYGNSENVYMSYLKLFYCKGSYKNITNLIQKVKSSPVRISGNLLKTVRFWS
ncbi:MAG: hypothetical protein Q8942_01605 [Bacillota bacterium]|nr:hypothetical protein [Bacillota bacterium]